MINSFINLFQTTIRKIQSRQWDVVVLQEQSQRPAFGEAYVCADTVPPLKRLINVIRENRKDTIAQVSRKRLICNYSIYEYI